MEKVPVLNVSWNSHVFTQQRGIRFRTDMNDRIKTIVQGLLIYLF